MGAGNPTISRETETQVRATPHRGTKVTTPKETLRIQTQRVPIKKKKKKERKGRDEFRGRDLHIHRNL